MEETSGVVENLDTIRADLAKAPKPEPVVAEPAKAEGDPAKVEPVTPAKKEFEAITSQEEFEKKLGARLAREQRQFEKRFQEEREARIRLEERLSAAKPAEPQAVDGEPKLGDFDDFAKYAKALARWEAKQVVNEETKQSRETQSAEQQRYREAQQAQSWQKRVEAYQAIRPDYSEVLSNSSAPLTNAMKVAIVDSEQGPALAIYLVEHPEEAQAIAANTSDDSKESVARAVRALTLIEAGFAKKPVTKTPEPISPTGARQTSGVKSLRDSGSTEEFWKRRRAFIANERAKF